VADARGDGVATSELRLLLAVVLGPAGGGGATEARRGDAEEDADRRRGFAAERARLAAVAPSRDPATTQPCRFFVGTGRCRAGERCTFRHALMPGEARPACPHFGTPRGCRFGDGCGFGHNDEQPGRRAERAAVARTAERLRLSAVAMLAGKRCYDAQLGRQRDTLTGGGLRALLAGKHVCLIGEGDFAFAEELLRGDSAAGLEPNMLVATSLDDQAAVEAKYPAAAARLARLEAMGSEAMVLHGVDARALHRDAGIVGLIRGGLLGAIVWQFPFNGVDDDTAGNAQLLKEFFRSVGLARWQGAAGRALGGVRVALTMRPEEFGQWAVLRSAREAMFTLTEVRTVTNRWA
jgi:hypothetical protein